MSRRGGSKGRKKRGKKKTKIVAEAALACSLAGHYAECRFPNVCGCWCHP